MKESINEFLPGQSHSQFLRQPRPHVCMFSKSPVLNSLCRSSPGQKRTEPLPRREVAFPGLRFRLNSDGLPEKDSCGPQEAVGSWRSGKSVPQGPTPRCPPARCPWHTAEWGKPARHTGTLHLLSDPKYIKMGALTPATRRGSGMNWGVVKIADLSLFSQEKYLFHRALLFGKLRLLQTASI